MVRETVNTYDEVVEAVRRFNEGLDEGKDLETLLSFFRAWYYIPELDAVGPSKFIGYSSMTVTEYMESTDLDGLVTEPLLTRWFDVLDEQSPEGHYVSDLVRRLLARYDKAPNRIARFNAPRGWWLGGHGARPLRPSIQRENSEGDARPIVEVFWRAFLSLYPEDQDALARRIIEHRGSRE